MSLWIRDTNVDDSLEKLDKVLELCSALEVHTGPFAVENSAARVWVVPLLSWYRSEETDPNTLHISKAGEDWENCPWMDKYLCKWPSTGPEQGAIATTLARLNEPAVERSYDAPVISFSHFLPRQELLFSCPDTAMQFCRDGAVIPAYPADPIPTFNFSRVAGCRDIEQQIRKVGSLVHVYGHQHRNRRRLIDGVLYVSNCLGYLHEREVLDTPPSPLLVWNNGKFLEPDEEM